MSKSGQVRIASDHSVPLDWQPTNPAWLMGALYCYNAGMAALGRPDDAIQHLQQAVDRGFANAAKWLPVTT